MTSGVQGSGVKRVQVTFASGKQVLDSYWGFLANGGLILPSSDELKVGDEVAIDVIVESLHREFGFRGQVVNRPPSHSWVDVAYIAFHPGQPHDMMLSAAWAEADHTAARRSQRRPCDVEVRYQPVGTLADGSTTLIGRMMNVSEAGALVRAPVLFPVGTQLTILLDGAEVRALVAWKLEPPGMLMGLAFESGIDDAAKRRIGQLLAELGAASEARAVRVSLIN